MSQKKQREDHNTIRLPENLTNEMDKLIGTRGFTSRAEIAKHAIREFLEKIQVEKPQPRFEQINADENGTKILDRKLHEVVNVYIKPKGILCGLDQTNDCEHIKFAIKIPQIEALIKKKRAEGWKIELPDE